MWKLTRFSFSREQILGYEDTDGGIVSIIRRLMRMKHLIRLVLTAAVVMSIIGPCFLGELCAPFDRSPILVQVVN